MSRNVRIATVASVTALFLSLAPAVGHAAEGDLEDYLADAAEASYAGQRATWCTYAGKTEFSIVSIEHAGSMLMVESAGSSQVLGGGRASDNSTGN
nr:hypothetical protein [Acidimicrobiia bacterium]